MESESIANEAETADHSRTTNFVYFLRIGTDPFVKIGWTSDLDRRLVTIQTCHHDEYWYMLAMPGGPQEESGLHRRFAKDRVTGEWFTLSDEIASFVEGELPKHKGIMDGLLKPSLSVSEAEALFERLNRSLTPPSTI